MPLSVISPASAAFRWPPPSLSPPKSSHGSAFVAFFASQSGLCSSDQIIPAGKRTRMRRLHNLICYGQGGKHPTEGNSSQEVDISVFRFTLGIPGFDDSELPRLLGFLLGGMLVLNHFLTLSTLTSSQLWSEAIGMILAVVAVNLPSLGRRLRGAKNKKVSKLQSTRTQIFVLDDKLKQGHKEELAWASYAILRNTKILAMMFWFSGRVICARGYWNLDLKPKGVKELEWLESILQQTPFYTRNGEFYHRNEQDVWGWSMMLPGTIFFFGQTFMLSDTQNKDPTFPSHGLLVVSNSVELSLKDRTWIILIGKKLVDFFESKELNCPYMIPWPIIT